MARGVLLPFLLSVLIVGPAAAQQPAAPAAPPPAAQAPESSVPGAGGAFNGRSGRWTQVERGHWRYEERVDFDLGGGVKLFADMVDYYVDDSRLVAAGNVVFTNQEGRLSAEQVEFNLLTQNGTFHQASGIMSLGTQVDRRQFGNQDPDVYFYGDLIEKLGTRKYKVTRGGFTTCVQPTPRWEIVSGSVVLNLNDYALARNTLLKVKGVPLMYLPVIYYPIQDDDRATGFLLPTYGTSTVRGQAISNAFFWAINRSQDATFFHDWFTRTGQGEGAEYRYAAGPQSLGNFRLYRFQQRASEFTQSGRTTTLPAKNILQATSAVTHRLTNTLRAQVNVDYFSDVFLQQLYNQNIYQATQAQRRISMGLSGASGPVSGGLYYTRNEVFGSSTSSTLYGTTPRAVAALAPQRFFGLPVYGGVNTDFSYVPNKSFSVDSKTGKQVTSSDTSLGRLDVAPTLRAPLSKLTFLSVNTTAGYRTTMYTRSLDAKGQLVPESLRREYFSTRTEVVGPVFTKIWDTPDRETIQRMKHVIEPTFAVEYITGFANQTSVPRLSIDPADFVVGASTRSTYGLTNRLLYRSRDLEGGARGTTREFMTISVQQTYYTNKQSSLYDSSYVTGTSRTRAVSLSPVALVARLSPSSGFDSNTRVEYDVNGNGLQSFTTGTTISGQHISTSANFNRQHFNSSSKPSSYLSASTSLNSSRSRATYALQWNIAQGYVMSQSLIASYMAQCCGLQFEIQQYNYPPNSGYPVTADRRFNFGFVLAGLGTFSNFFGAFGGGSVSVR
jgi:LPS-assembly protein